jgi:hypothetical protein
LAIASGATPIGSAGRAPDENKKQFEDKSRQQKKKKKLEIVIDYKYPPISKLKENITK